MEETLHLHTELLGSYNYKAITKRNCHRLSDLSSSIAFSAKTEPTIARTDAATT